MKRMMMWLLLLSLCAAISGCGMSDTMKDGYYTAEMAEFSHGWKEYLCIYVQNDKIVSAEFNAKDPNGFIKAWDNEYMHNMVSINGNYPNKYTRHYVQQLIDGQKDIQVDTMTGATSSGDNFEKLAAAVIEQAKKGDASVVAVP